MGERAGPVRDLDGTVTEWVGIAIDIEEPKQAMTSLDEPVLDQEVAGDTPAAPGEIRHWLISFYPVRTGPEITGVGAVAIDETARRRAELEMARLADT